jgi:hypothetical protein
VGAGSSDEGRQAAPAVIVGAQNTEDHHFQEYMCLLAQSGNLLKRKHSWNYDAAYTKLFMVKTNSPGIGRSCHTAKVNIQAWVSASSILEHRQIRHYNGIGTNIVGIVNSPKALF